MNRKNFLSVLILMIMIAVYSRTFCMADESMFIDDVIIRAKLELVFTEQKFLENKEIGILGKFVRFIRQNLETLEIVDFNRKADPNSNLNKNYQKTKEFLKAFFDSRIMIYLISVIIICSLLLKGIEIKNKYERKRQIKDEEIQFSHINKLTNQNKESRRQAFNTNKLSNRTKMIRLFELLGKVSKYASVFIIILIVLITSYRIFVSKLEAIPYSIHNRDGNGIMSAYLLIGELGLSTYRTDTGIYNFLTKKDFTAVIFDTNIKAMTEDQEISRLHKFINNGNNIILVINSSTMETFLNKNFFKGYKKFENTYFNEYGKIISIINPDNFTNDKIRLEKNAIEFVRTVERARHRDIIFVGYNAKNKIEDKINLVEDNFENIVILLVSFMVIRFSTKIWLKRIMYRKENLNDLNKIIKENYIKRSLFNYDENQLESLGQFRMKIDEKPKSDTKLKSRLEPNEINPQKRENVDKHVMLLREFYKYFKKSLCEYLKINPESSNQIIIESIKNNNSLRELDFDRLIIVCQDVNNLSNITNDDFLQIYANLKEAVEILKKIKGRDESLV